MKPESSTNYLLIPSMCKNWALSNSSTRISSHIRPRIQTLLQQWQATWGVQSRQLKHLRPARMRLSTSLRCVTLTTKLVQQYNLQKMRIWAPKRNQKRRKTFGQRNKMKLKGRKKLIKSWNHFLSNTPRNNIKIRNTKTLRLNCLSMLALPPPLEASKPRPSVRGTLHLATKGTPSTKWWSTLTRLAKTFPWGSRKYKMQLCRL